MRQRYDGRGELEGTRGNLKGLQTSFQKETQYDLATSGCRFDEEDYDEKKAEAKPASVMEGSRDGDEDEQRSNSHPKVSSR